MGFAAVSNDDLVTQLRSTERQLVQARFQHSMGQLDNSSSLDILRKNVARILTELRAREAAEGLPKGSLCRGSSCLAPVDGDASSEAASDAGFLKGIVDKMAPGQ